VFPYWKARAYLTACIALVWENNIYVDGRYINTDMVSKLCEGKVFVPNDNDHGGMNFYGKIFDPEYMALDSEKFLGEVDEGRFLKKAALGLWLELEDSGFMRSGFGEPPRDAYSMLFKNI